MAENNFNNSVLEAFPLLEPDIAELHLRNVTIGGEKLFMLPDYKRSWFHFLMKKKIIYF